jgi:hypothetical protein
MLSAFNKGYDQKYVVNQNACIFNAFIFSLC